MKYFKATKFMLIYFIFNPISGYCQETEGIKFETTLSWEQVKEKAKNENKYIFVDCYATWCKPCKNMEMNIFPKADVGKFLNENFINIKIQMDSTRLDSDYIKSWYQTRQLFETEYDISSYPTYLFFNRNGELVNKEIGEVKNTDQFLKRCMNSMDTNFQYYTLLKKYYSGERHQLLVRNLVQKATVLGDRKVATDAGEEYFLLLDNPYTKENLKLLGDLIKSSESQLFKFFLNQTEKIDSIVKETSFAEETMMRILVYEINRDYIYKNNGNINWKVIYNYINKRAPSVSNQLLLKLKVEDALKRNEWEKYAYNLLTYYDQYFNKMTYYDQFLMNNKLWAIFENCNNKKTLERAALWSKRTLLRNGLYEEPMPMDTYANLLYKAGHVNEAIAWESKALNIVSKKNDLEAVNDFSKTLEKMKKGIPTWPIGR